MKCISEENLKRSLELEDLSEKEGYAMNLIVNRIKEALSSNYSLEPIIEKGQKVVSLDDNYWKLGYDSSEVTLSSRYTRYVSENAILRTQMTAIIPEILEKYSKTSMERTLWMCPGLVYRRDVVDRTHVGEPHQMDIWYIKEGETTREDLLELIRIIVGVVEKILGKKLKYRINETKHHYTEDGVEVEILHQGKWLEILECGLAGKKLLRNSGIDINKYGGLALGMGLDRLVMLCKNIGDIRILRSKDERILKQMKNLKKYKEVSNQPAIKRDLSLALSSGYILEELTEKIMLLLEKDSDILEEVKLKAVTTYDKLPDIARERLGISELQENWLIQVKLRHPVRSIPSEEANNIYCRLYSSLHEGTKGYI